MHCWWKKERMFGLGCHIGICYCCSQTLSSFLLHKNWEEPTHSSERLATCGNKYNYFTSISMASVNVTKPVNKNLSTLRIMINPPLHLQSKKTPNMERLGMPGCIFKGRTQGLWGSFRSWFEDQGVFLKSPGSFSVPYLACHQWYACSQKTEHYMV